MQRCAAVDPRWRVDPAVEQRQAGARPVTWKVEFTNAATRELAKLDRSVQVRVSSAIDHLAEDPRPAGCVKLSGGDDRWRIRVGDYRIVYMILGDQVLVVVVRIAHRREVYRSF
ncbi:type II toxin-antitoxin system RelE/ParE family toxin [Micromonospora fluostatini]|uniref:Type II toxin-antitoxin system RelE/ParE family toxin n=1 Tax=Micromonospora fluostatini TaxID=1629071 RepID=A0ABY2DJ81_9ACTN|nr:type II toxin-antitoxin system RelE/ParE family toxin [Micromonospora fluostatini]